MSLLSETSATVLQYDSLSASKIGLGDSTVITNGINFVKVTGKVDIAGTSGNTTHVLQDLSTGRPVSIRGLLVWSTLLEANPAITDSGNIFYAVVGIRASDGDYKVYDSGKTTATVNDKYMLIPYDDGVEGYQLLPNEYSILGVRVDGAGSVTTGTIYVTFVGISIPLD